MLSKGSLKDRARRSYCNATNKETLGLVSVVSMDRRTPMSALTFTNLTAVPVSDLTPAKPVKLSFGKRLVAAMVASRRRSAEIEIRRVRMMLADSNVKIDYAMLPFSGE
jgi:hypothetical protein